MGSDGDGTPNKRGRPSSLTLEELDYVFQVAPSIRDLDDKTLRKQDYRVRRYAGMTLKEILGRKIPYTWDGVFHVYGSNDFRYDRDAGRIVGVPSQAEVS